MPKDDQALKNQIADAEAVRDDARARFEKAKGAYEQAKFELGVAKADLDAAEARVAGLFELQSSYELQEGPRDTRPLELSALSRTDAIVQILKASDGHMGIGDVLAELEQHDPDVKYPVVASTLNYLVKEGRVQRPTRGRYAAN